jgi:hypothetical protein
VYLNTQWCDQHQHARTTTFVEPHLHQARALEPETAAARESLARALERLTHWGQQHLHQPGERAMPGVALFACATADLWVEFPSPLPFEDEFTVADCPMVRQLARLDDDDTKALLVLVDSRTARIYEAVLGDSSQRPILPVKYPDGISKGDGPRPAINAMCRSTASAITTRAPRLLTPTWPRIPHAPDPQWTQRHRGRISSLVAPVCARPGHRDRGTGGSHGAGSPPGGWPG